MSNLSSKILERLPKRHLEFLRELGDFADKKKSKLYLVGGFVRDIILEYPNLDMDFVFVGDAISFVSNFTKRKKKVRVKKYPEFNTATLVFSKNLRVDIASCRKEKYPEPAALPLVSKGSLRQDLMRRDFTINSMAISVNKNFGRLVDYSNGYEDLKKGIIRIHHEKSFVDDPTRIFRAIRFKVRYGFKIESNTSKLMRKALHDKLIEKLTPVRIKHELVLLLEEKYPKEAMANLEKLGLFLHINKNFKIGDSLELYDEIDIRRKDIKVWFLYFLPLVYSTTLATSIEIGKRLGFTKKEEEAIIKLHIAKERLKKLPKDPLPSEVYTFCRELPGEVIYFLSSVSKKELGQYLDKYSKVRLEITGKDLKKMNIEEGPIYKEILEKTLLAKVDGKIKTKEKELEFVKNYLESS